MSVLRPGHSVRLSRRGFGRLCLAGIASVMGNELQATTPEEIRRLLPVIFVSLEGGISPFESFDPKPEAPMEIRGRWGVVRTKLHHALFCEKLPLLEKQQDTFTLIRTLTGTQGNHSKASVELLGQPTLARQLQEVMRLQKKSMPKGLPPYVISRAPPPFGEPGIEDGHQSTFASLTVKSNWEKPRGLRKPELGPQLPPGRLEERVSLLRDFQGTLDPFQEQALDLLNGGGKFWKALQLNPATVQAYGGDRTAEILCATEQLALAGVPWTTLTFGSWDHHKDIFTLIKPQLERLDHAISTLMERTYRRAVVVVCGEFGRTPHINGNHGRDHWPHNHSAIICAGREGSVYGKTSVDGSRIADAPVTTDRFRKTILAAAGLSYPSDEIIPLGRR